MSLAELFELPKTDSDWAMWSFAHQAFHHDVDQTIARTYSVTLAEYALDPFNPTDTQWLYNHQESHNARNAVLGVKGYDLTNLDLSNEQSVIDWINLHASEEQYAAEKLNLS